MAEDNTQLNLATTVGDLMATRLLTTGEKIQHVQMGWGSGMGVTYMDDDQPMPVASPAKVESGNSSTATLGPGGVFTGAPVDVTIYATVTVFVNSDVDGTLALQFSIDGINWDEEKLVVLEQAIGKGSFHSTDVAAQFFRVVFTNGSSAQTHFRLQTLLHSGRSGSFRSSTDQRISKIDDALIVRVANSPRLDIARGLYADKYSLHRSARNSAVSNLSFEDIWTYGTTAPLYPWPAAAEPLRVRAGGDAADAAGGAGARTIQLIYLNQAGERTQVQLALAGASESAPTVIDATRFVRAWVDSTGTALGSNVGAILIENAVSNQVLAEIPSGKGETSMTQFTVPLDHTAYLTRAHVGVEVAIGLTKLADIRMWQRREALTFSAPFGAKRLVREWTDIQGQSDLPIESSLPFPALTDLWFDAKGNMGTTKICVDYDLVLVRSEAPSGPQ